MERLAPEECSQYSLSVRTWDNYDFLVNNGFVCRVYNKPEYKDVTTSFKFTVGASEQEVAFANIRELAFQSQRNGRAKLTVISGSTTEVAINEADYMYLYLGGVLEPFGDGWIPLRDVASLTIVANQAP